MQKKIILLFMLTLVGSFGFGQFTTTGDTEAGGCNCFDMTADAPAEDGSFYNTSTINLNDPFNFKFTVNFGCEETGGEGLAFVLQNGAWATGSGSFGLGYDGIAGNNLAVEFDTRDNDASGEITNFDIAGDHISLQDNGDSDHESINPNNLLGVPSGLNAGELATPHNIKPGFPNIEDCEDHVVEISWTPGPNQTIQIKIDNITTLTYIGDMISDQFGGNPTVRWGWTGATGILPNLQTVCMATVSDFSYSATNCPGEVINFTNTSYTFYPIASYEWDFAGLGTSALENPDFTFDTAGEYDVELTITDSEGCENTTTVTIPVGFNTEVTADDLIVCPDGTTILHAEGSPFEATECCFKLVVNDLWGDYWGSGIPNNVELFADGISFGTYTPISFDPGSGSTDTFDLCFDQGTELEFVINGADSPAECSYYFLEDDLTEIFSVNGASPGAWVDGATETHTVDCGLVAPEYDYLWDNPALLSDVTDENPTATLPADTWFYVEITDPATGCTITDSIEITIHPPVEATISGTDDICEGELGELTITFTGTAPYEITINGPSGPLPIITGILTSPYMLEVGEDGDYTINYVTGDGCEGTFSGSGTINVTVPFDVAIAADATYCDGDPIADLTVTSTEGGTVNWYDNPGLVPPVLATGMTFSPPSMVGTFTYYAAETEGGLGCTGAADEVTITINPIPPAPTFAGETAYCEDDDATAIFGEPSLGGNLTWYDAAPPMGTVLSTAISYTPTLVAPGLTLFITETADGCEGPATEINITVNPTPEAPLVTGDLEYCEGDAPTPLSATATLGGTIEWRTTAGAVLGTGPTYTPILVVGTSTIEVFEVLGGCESEATIIEINVDEFPTITIPENLSICFGDSVLVTAENNGYPITWSDGQEGEAVWFKPLATFTYTGTATNPACGAATDDVLITVYDLPAITSVNDTVIGIGGEAQLWASSDDATAFSWSPAVYECLLDDCSSAYAVPDRATVYVVTVTDERGCMNSDTVFVDVNGIMEIFVPNVFSPNGDGYNDVLLVYGPRLFNFNIEVYDRWGKRVFETNEQKEGWDGTFNDTNLPAQTFVYIVTGETILGEAVKIEGNVTIIR